MFNKKIFVSKRIGITAIDLEQKEHRGIAAVTKSLIEILYKNGAEIYLITSLGSSSYSGVNKKSLKNNVYISDTLDALKKGFNYRYDFKNNINYAIRLILKLIKSLFKLHLNNFKLEYKIFYIEKNEQFLNKIDSRIEYMKCIKGFIFSENIFNLCRLRSMRLISKVPEFNINKKDLDLIISTCPLSIKRKNAKYTEIIQIIHDAIPIQLTSHPENPKVFYNRLYDSHKSCNCIYVSKESKRVVKSLLKIKKNNSYQEEVIYPSPSLTLGKLEEANKISSIKSIKKPFILFNSSIVERKKVENAILFFKKSNLADRGFLLCIAGKLHNTKYSEFIKNICNCEKNIFLLDYVNEIEKAWLFLNTSLLITTSSFEGFGIPLLDALSINLPALASDIPSHKEIKNLTENNFLNLVNLRKSEEWVKRLNNTKEVGIGDLEIKLDRINMYKEFSYFFEKDLILKIKRFIN